MAVACAPEGAGGTHPVGVHVRGVGLAPMRKQSHGLVVVHLPIFATPD